LNIEALDTLHESGVRLVITVDCGIRSFIEAEHARGIGLDLIISDHHHPLQELPQAVAVLNPKQAGDLPQYRDLAGVGLAYELAAALAAALGTNPADSLDLVALGTVADLAPLVGENRSLVRRGIEQIKAARRQGIVSLIGASGLKTFSVSAGDIGYVLAPRLNAAGRLDSALAAYSLLISQDVNETGRLAQQLDDQNRERQRITRAISARAEQIALSEEAQPWLIFAADPEFNPGVVGLAAARLVESYYRPAIVAFTDVETTRASCRSIPEFHITQALDQCADLLEHHGGHAAAAGFTVRNERLPELIERLKAIAVEQLSPFDLRPVIKADLELPLSALKPEILAYLSWLQPTGNGNREALFLSRNLKVRHKRAVGKDAAHLKLSVSDGRITYDAIAFRQGYMLDQIDEGVDLMYTFETNEFNGQLSLQLNVRDIQPIQR
jgi:single-stranded-DNA-specific exonuclease